MRLSSLFIAIGLSLAVQASWFGGNNEGSPPYSTWSTAELRLWLEEHSVPVPKHTTPTQAELRDLVAAHWNSYSAWTQDQYAAAQKTFADIRDSTFEKWDESTLRQFLLEQGVIAPKGTKEELVLLAKEKYKAYTDAASSFSARASTAVYGDSAYQMTKSASSLVSQASAAVANRFDESKDYVYSSWDEAQMRKYLESKGLLKTKAQKEHAELLEMMHGVYGRATKPIWKAWSDSYIHHWLVSHNIIKSTVQKNREYYLGLMEKYYYDQLDTVWSTWSDSQLKQWLVEHDVIKSDAQVTRDKMTKLIQDNYYSAKDTFWHAWSDNQVRDYLVENGYIRSDAQVRRDELYKLANEKYNDASARTAAYLAWPDARLRAYLREHGVSEEVVPGDRPGLLQETRIRWVQTQTRAEALLAKIQELVNDSVYKTEDVLSRVLSVLSGGWVEVRDRVTNGYDVHQPVETAEKAYEEAKKSGESYKEDVKGKAKEAKETVDEKVKAGQKATSEL